MKFKLILISCLLFLSLSATTKDRHIWLTTSFNTKQVNPGIETGLFFHENFGVQLGASAYFRTLPKERLSNLQIPGSAGFSNFNIGPSFIFDLDNQHKLGFTAGFKIYYSPWYKKLAYFEEEDYWVYYDASHLSRPDYGLDVGVNYVYNRFSAILKYDTARHWIRLGAGIRLIKSN